LPEGGSIGITVVPLMDALFLKEGGDFFIKSQNGLKISQCRFFR
jgi:hypothetical protein